MSARVTLSLIEKACGRDPRAVRDLVARLTPILQRRIARVLLAQGAAQDGDVRQDLVELIQHVYAALLANDGRLIRMWEPKRGSIERFFGNIAEQAARKFLRRRAESPWSEQLVEPDAPPESSLDITDSREAIALIMDQMRAGLPDIGQRLVELLFVEARPVAEVARMMNMSEEAVYAWRSRLQAKLPISER